ncbi:hypothetical protein OPV22_027200 [Ensete ventricosum]|uniref:Uncharacterized protein n=1 Tax=Ensete ventricosum TaxID=4639 RepID=A0AAV8PUM0_ENSVE|nr:hypothetical protein OPV22_027200 [Ensete ventricosum]
MEAQPPRPATEAAGEGGRPSLHPRQQPSASGGCGRRQGRAPAFHAGGRRQAGDARRFAANDGGCGPPPLLPRLQLTWLRATAMAVEATPPSMGPIGSDGGTC